MATQRILRLITCEEARALSDREAPIPERDLVIGSAHLLDDDVVAILVNEAALIREAFELRTES